MKIHNLILSAMILLVLSLNSKNSAQDVTKNLTTDPYKAPFIYEDVQNYIKAHKMLVSGVDTLTILQTEYLDKATPGLQMFIEKYGLDPERLVKAMRKHPDKYASLETLPPMLDNLAVEAKKSFVKLKDVIPHAVFPPTYFLIESHRGIGSGSIEGQLISVDKWVAPIEDETTMIIHELVHFQQVVAVGYDKYKLLFGPEKSLLGLCIREGTAEFFANLVTGEMTQDEAVEFTLKNERRLWDQFQQEMNGRETGDWMWSKPEDPDQPRHVGYVLGAFIVESYYNQANDKAQAVKEILSVTDYAGFLRKSKYEQKFNR